MAKLFRTTILIIEHSFLLYIRDLNKIYIVVSYIDSPLEKFEAREIE